MSGVCEKLEVKSLWLTRPLHHNDIRIVIMAISSIDIFPLFKQLPAVIEPAKPTREMLLLAAEIYGPNWYDGKVHKNFQRGIKEDF